LRGEGRLVIYSLLAVPEHSRIVNHFREKYPFVEVSLTRPGASERITARVMTESARRTAFGRRDRYQPAQYDGAHPRSLIMNYESPERARRDPAFKDRNGFWTAFYVNPEVTAYNTRLIASTAAPKAYGDLLEPRWNGQLAFRANRHRVVRDPAAPCWSGSQNTDSR
jgi:ABC-type Fe3+ transport system substrate-binding protein